MYSLNEISLIPTVISEVEHRKDVNPFYPLSYLKSGIVQNTFAKLPIFIAPMTCIIDSNNYDTFKKSKAIPIIPRGVGRSNNDIIYTGSNDWVAYSLSEFKDSFCDESIYESNWEGKVLIDVANGHMKCIYDYVKKAKSIWKDQLTIMIGNIANPKTYVDCCKAGVDYVRVGIGGGSGCSTSVQTGFHASLPWLLTEIQKVKNEINHFETEDKDLLIRRTDKEIWQSWQCNGFRTKVIADGGIDTIDKAIKCLALGADYVMMGKAFAQCEEACGETRKGQRYFDVLEPDFGPFTNTLLPPKDLKTFRRYYGMASERGQKDISGGVTKNPEGIETWVEVKYTLNEFLSKFEAALRSAMSYAGAFSLDQFIGKVKYEVQSFSEFNAYYK